MLSTLIGDVKTGRLLRLQYLGYSIFVTVLVFVFFMLLILAIGAGEHLLGGNLQEAQDQLREWFTLPFMVIFALFIIFIAFVGFNLMAKRIRDIGLPGWWTVLVIVLVESLVSYSITPQTSSGLHTLIWLILVLVPSNALLKK